MALPVNNNSPYLPCQFLRKGQVWFGENTTLPKIFKYGDKFKTSDSKFCKSFFTYIRNFGNFVNFKGRA